MKKGRIFAVFLVALCFLGCSGSRTKKAKEENHFSAVKLVKTVGKIDIIVDPNVEMMHIIQRISGLHPERNNMEEGPYIEKVDEYFEQYALHSGVKNLKDYRLIYQRASEFGMYLKSDLSDFIMKPDNEKFIVSDGPAKKNPSFYDSILRESIRKFRIESNFDQFFISNQADYEELIEKHAQIIEKANMASWLENFYGIRQKDNLCLYLTRITGNFGISFVNPKGRVVPHAVVIDADSAEESLYLISHEFSHPMTREIVDELYRDTVIRGYFDKLYYENAIHFNSMGYGNGYSVLIETINQACANKYIEGILPEDTMDRVNSYQIEYKKMIYIPAISEFLNVYQNNRKKYKTLKDFVPELKKFLVAFEPWDAN